MRANNICLMSMVIAAVLACSVLAHALESRDSSLFTYKYEGNVVGAAPDFEIPDYSTYLWGSDTSTVSATSDGSYLTYSAPGDEVGMVRWKGDTLWDSVINSSTGFTIETRVQVLVDDPNGVFGFWAGTGSGGGANIFWITATQTGLWNALLDTGDNTDGLHVYRAACEPGAAVWQVWRDGQLLGSTSLKWSSYGGMEFGMESGIWGGSAKVDYYRWTAGAYAPAPVPEPSSFATLLGGRGSAGLVWRTRRRFKH